MMKLKAVFRHLYFALADVIIRLQASPLVVQKCTIKIGIDPQFGYYSPKGPPWIKTVDLAYLNATDQTMVNVWNK